ncbi:MAG: sulfotransferase [Bacteroidales bacterium]|nr:sulfotransferase [Bacteroidales bacterium]MCF8337152.1 sulfotransferase [Bacteroidales bacterium]
MIEDAPIFLIASERSGTNLLRKKITEAQDYYFGPSPAHFYKHLFEATPFYGPLSNDNNFKTLISFALELCYNHFAPWDIKMTSEDVFKEYSDNYQKRNTILLGHFLMTKYAKFKGYQSYFCKDNYIYNFIFAILHEIPNAKFIYLYRDPRDYAVSQLNRSLHSNNIIKIAQIWKHEQIKALAARELLSKKQIHLISYEDFITDEPGTIHLILNFLNIEKASRKINVKFEDYLNIEEWKNLSKPTMKSNYKKYLKELTKNQLKMVESICWYQMKKLNYTTEFEKKPKIGKVYKKIYTIYFLVADKIRRFFIVKNPEFEWSRKRNKAIRSYKNYFL